MAKRGKEQSRKPSAAKRQAADMATKLVRAEGARTRDEARIKGLVERLVSVQEEERRRLSRDLHDQLGQQLTALRLTLDLLDRMVGDPAVLAQVRIADTIVAQLDRDVDHLAWSLRPAALDELGLVAALDAFVHEWSQHHHLPAEVHAPIGDARFTADIENNLYRIVQEALNNVVKHAQATKVRVTLGRSKHHLRLTVHDNGHGFDQSAANRQTGMGLLGMRERVALIGGQIEIESSPSRGTTVSVRLPIS